MRNQTASNVGASRIGINSLRQLALLANNGGRRGWHRSRRAATPSTRRTIAARIGINMALA